MADDQAPEPTVEDRLDQLASVFAGLGTEIRTRRVVIADERDQERITAEVIGGHAELRLGWPSSQSFAGTGVVLFSLSGGEDAPPGIGLQLWADGNALLEINAWRDELGAWSTDVQLEASEPTNPRKEKP